MPLRRFCRGKAAWESIVAVSQKTCPSSNAKWCPGPGTRQVRYIRACGILPAFFGPTLLCPDRQEGKNVPGTQNRNSSIVRAVGLLPSPRPVSPRPILLLAIPLPAVSLRPVRHRANFRLLGALHAARGIRWSLRALAGLARWGVASSAILRNAFLDDGPLTVAFFAVRALEERQFRARSGWSIGGFAPAV